MAAEEFSTENLSALVKGIELNSYQRALALNEYKKLKELLKNKYGSKNKQP